MSSILTTLYAAEGGDAASRYAAALAEALGASLQIVYPYTVPVTLGEMPMPLLPVEEVHNSAKLRLTNLQQELRTSHPGLDINGDVVYGMLGDVLDEQDGRPAPLMSVIGNGDSDDSGEWLGSESADILRESSGAVLAVPRSIVFQKPQFVCLACDAQSIRDGLAVSALLELQAALGFKLTVLHVAGADGSVSFEGSRLAQQLAGAMPGFAEVGTAEGAEVDAAIAAYADEHGMDWLAIAPHHYGFWAGLFHKSHTSRVLHLAHVPVLALHG